MGAIFDAISKSEKITCKESKNHFKFCDGNGKSLLTVRENGFIEMHDGVNFALAGYAYQADKEGNRRFVSRGNKLEAVFNVNDGKLSLYNENGAVSNKQVEVSGKNNLAGSNYVMAYQNNGASR